MALGRGIGRGVSPAPPPGKNPYLLLTLLLMIFRRANNDDWLFQRLKQ